MTRFPFRCLVFHTFFCSPCSRSDPESPPFHTCIRPSFPSPPCLHLFPYSAEAQECRAHLPYLSHSSILPFFLWLFPWSACPSLVHSLHVLAHNNYNHNHVTCPAWSMHVVHTQWTTNSICGYDSSIALSTFLLLFVFFLLAPTVPLYLCSASVCCRVVACPIRSNPHSLLFSM